MKKVNKRNIQKYTRMLIQLIFFLIMPSVYTTAFSGVKYIFTQMGNIQPLELTSFVTILIVLCLYTMVFGRFFCGFACAFGTLGDYLHELYLWLCRKTKRRPIKINDSVKQKLSTVKYFILAAIVILCFKGVYQITKGFSPWDVFSMIIAGNFQINDYIPALIILLIIVAGMLVCERFFCRFLCTMGAIFSLLPVLPIFSIERNREQCIKECSACKRVCPSGIELPNSGDDIQSGDCFMCQKCMNICPKQNIKTSTIKGNSIIFILVRAVILVIIMKLAGI